MQLFPAIDLRGGQVVRLAKGDFDAETVYGSDPVSVAQSFAEAGAQWIHVVDLDAARTGKARNRVLVAAIAESVDIAIQTGGGVRDRHSAEALLDTGAARIVLGTVASEEPGLVEWLAHRYPGRIAVGLDGRNGQIAVRGWVESASTTVVDMVHRYAQSGVSAFIVTDIDRDGMLGGADLSGLSAVIAETDCDVIASGGVGTLDDIRALAKMNVGGYRRPAGVIVGKALYEGRFTVQEALAACEVEVEVDDA